MTISCSDITTSTQTTWQRQRQTLSQYVKDNSSGSRDDYTPGTSWKDQGRELKAPKERQQAPSPVEICHSHIQPFFMFHKVQLFVIFQGEIFVF